MNTHPSHDETATQEDKSPKKPYTGPVLSELGRINLKTQGGDPGFIGDTDRSFSGPIDSL